MALHPRCLLTAALCLLLVVLNQKSFVDTASLAKAQDPPEDFSTQTEDGNVQELENLKHSLGKTLEMIKSHSIEYVSNQNGQKDMHADIKEQVNSDGELVAKIAQHIDSAAEDDSTPVTKVRTEMQVPSKGLHHTITQESDQNPVITDNGNRRSINPDLNQEMANNVNKFNSYTGIQYSPLDMAEYVFWTGDEKGVTLAIEEFLQEGLMTREEAITFLQEIKYNLDYLQSHSSQQKVYSQNHSKDRLNTINKYLKINKPLNLNRNDENVKPQYDLDDLRQDMSKKNVINENQVNTKEDEDYEELLEKLRVADFLYTEYSLEEIIYQLSKIMFTQSLTRGSTEAQAALQKFTNFLETEAEAGHISRTLEKKVLDILIAALTDTLNEHPELIPAAREGLGGGGGSASNAQESNHLLRNLLESESLDRGTIKAALAPYKNQMKTNNQLLHKEQISGAAAPTASKLTPLGFGKFKAS